jgi:hypothetical protein
MLLSFIGVALLYCIPLLNFNLLIKIILLKNKSQKRILLTAINLFILISAYTQDLTGYWQGVFVSDLDRRRPGREFFLNMFLDQDGRKIEGRFSTSLMDFKNVPSVVYEISGNIGRKDKLPARLIVGKILYNTLPGMVAEAFLQFDDIRYFKNDTEEVLYGNWTASVATPRLDGAAGSFRIMKLRFYDSLLKKMPDSTLISQQTGIVVQKTDSLLIPTQMVKRKNTEQGQVVVNTKSITLSLYDNGIVDDDTVSIFLNGKLLVSHQRVSEKPIVLTIELDEQLSRNEITLFAENMGSITPNTALVIINAGNKRYELFSKASLEANAVLVIEYKPD